jgi:hypothetical protein
MTLADTPTSSFAARLRRQHQDLARRCLSEPVSADERRAFIDDLAASGKALPPGRDRDAVRKLLYYWTADAVSRGERPRDQPLPSLQPFNGDQPDAETAVARVFTTAQSSEDIEATTADTRAAIRMATLARQWLADGRSDGYLLTDEALKEAERLADKDPDIRTLVDASRAAEVHRVKRSRRFLAGLVAGLLAVIIVMAVGGVYLWRFNGELNMANRDLKEAIEVQTAINNRNQEEIRAVVDALRQGGDHALDPLKTLLRRVGDAQPSELARLQYKPPDSAAANLGDRVVIPSDPGAPLPVRPSPTGPITCDGVLWLGSEEAKLIVEPGLLASLQGSEKVTVKEGVNIRLRGDMPTMPAYTMAPQVGLVPGGAQLILTGKPKGFLRSNGVQFFAPVKAPREYCTRVFIQYDGDRPRADEMRRQLAELSVQVPPAQRVDKVPRIAEIRYFTTDDRRMAELVADKARSFNGGNRLLLRPLLDIPRKPEPGTLEVWIDLGR